MTIAAPVIVAEMADWTKLGGGNSGIIGDTSHSYGFHCSANSIPPTDYSRANDPNGPYGPFVNWDYACAGDFSHKKIESLRVLHRTVFNGLLNGKFPMICEFIGQPWVDRPVYYWARWNGVNYFELYEGSGHDHWSHISWYRSQVDKRAYLWTTQNSASPSKTTQVLAREVIQGLWGNGADRVSRLTTAGYNATAVQAEVNRLLSPSPIVLKSTETVAKEVILGYWGNGTDRRNRLAAAGYDPDAIQAVVNSRLGNVTLIARAVIRGDYGNGTTRINRLRSAGYDPAAVQAEVNRLLGY